MSALADLELRMRSTGRMTRGGGGDEGRGGRTMNSRWNRGGSGGQARGGAAAHPPRQNSRWGGYSSGGGGHGRGGRGAGEPQMNSRWNLSSGPDLQKCN